MEASDNVAAASPETEFVRPCNLCPHMKTVTLSSILESLQTLEPRVEIPEALAARALLTLPLVVARGLGQRGGLARVLERARLALVLVHVHPPHDEARALEPERM